MSEEAEDIVVEVEPETPVEEKKVETEVKVEAAKPVKPEPDPAVEDLRRQHDELKARDADREERRKRAERDARQARDDAVKARQEAADARTEVVDSQLGTVESGLSAAQTEADSAEQEWVRAQEQGDFINAAKAQRKLATAVSRIERLQEAKADIEARKAEPVKQTKPEPDADPFERYLNQFTEPTRDWLRDHPDWIRDPKKNAKLQAAHHDAVASDLTPESDEYFEHVENFIGLRDKPKAKEEVAVTAHTRKKAAPPAAPVNGSGSGTSGRSNTVTLTPGEARAATDGTHVWNYSDPTGQKKFTKGDPIGTQEFARRKLEMQKQGLYDKTYSEQ